MDQLSAIKKVIQSVTKKTRKKKWPCFYPDCLNPSIMSHSQTRRTSLKNIAEKNGHVMQRNFNLLPPRENIGWEEIGIRKATRFHGFCNSHDDKLFKQADSISKKNITLKALALLSFRTFALEMRKKEIYSNQSKRMLFHQNKFIDPGAADHLKAHMEGMNNCIKVSKPYYMERYHRLIGSKDYTQMGHRIFISDINLGVSCSTSINPLEIGQFPYDKPQPEVAFNILPRKTYTLIVFSCFKEYISLMENFISKYQRIEDVVFNFCEEVVLSISLFQSLSDETLNIINKAQAPWTSWEPVNVPNIFNFVLKEDTLLAEL